MTGQHHVLSLAGPEPAGDLAAFLGRQLGWDRAAAARVQADGDTAAVFTSPARFGVLAAYPLRLAEPAALDVTVSAGELLHGIDDKRATVTVPGPVTGPAWAGLLPPRGGWRRLAELSAGDVRERAAAVVAEFRARTEALDAAARTRAALDALAEEIWSRPLPLPPPPDGAGPGPELPLRAVHAASALGFLRSPAPAAVLVRGPWLRLATPLGSTAVRVAGPAGGLPFTPVR
jgi:hypothetical protein